MKLQGTIDIKADRERVFGFLTDPSRVGPCLPKVQAVKTLPDGRFEAIAKIGKGFLSTTFTLQCAFTERVAPERAAIRATGKAKGSGVDGTARMELRELPDGRTAVDWTADVTISGLVARVGEGRLQAGAERLIEQTFRCVRKSLKAAVPDPGV
jgi:carbon monoxide dehydrogenase subunit G